MPVYKVIKQEYDYETENDRHMSWNDIGYTQYVNCSFKEIQNRVNVLNQQFKSEEIAKIEYRIHQLNSAIKAVENKIEVMAQLTSEQRITLGLDNTNFGLSLKSLNADLVKKESELTKVKQKPEQEDRRYYFEELDIESLEDIR